jgi:hypothetical protein
MLALMFDPNFKDLLVLSNCVGTEKPTIAMRYDYEILIPHLCSTYQKVHLFGKHPLDFGPQEWPLVVFGARLTQDQIVMEHVSFFVFAIICKLLFFVIKNSNKTSLSQMCNAKKLFLTIGAMRTYMFSNLQLVIESCEDSLKWWKAHEAQFPIVAYNT